MAQLYFKFGAMGSSKSANALMARFNYEERGQDTLLVKPQLDTRDGDHMVRSRIGLEHPCIYFHEMQQMADSDLQKFACIIVDEAQFLTKEEVYYLVHLVDDCNIPVICYGLKADFKGELFPGSYQLLVLADKLEEVKPSAGAGKKPPSTPGLTSKAVWSRREPRWCWEPMISISAFAAATGWPGIWARTSSP